MQFILLVLVPAEDSKEATLSTSVLQITLKSMILKHKISIDSKLLLFRRK